MVPEDRKTSGLFLGMDIVNNIAATVLRKVSSGAQFLASAKAEALAQDFVDELQIATPSVRQIVGNLSGGNQQKVLLAKWLAMEPKLLIVDEPTRGVDVGARSEIYRLLRALAERGVALLVVSSDLPEVLALADRIVVMAEGQHRGRTAGRRRRPRRRCCGSPPNTPPRSPKCAGSGRCGVYDMSDEAATRR